MQIINKKEKKSKKNDTTPVTPVEEVVTEPTTDDKEVVAAIVAAILSIPMTYLCITPIFGMMGATHIDYVIDPLKIFVMFPGIIVVLTVAVTFFTALYTKTIKASDTASIE